MNWNTKAKTRAGRGKNREDVENQQRLAAWNKTSRHKTNRYVVDRPVEHSTALPTNHQSNFPNQRKKFDISGDLLMLGEIPTYARSTPSQLSPQQPVPQLNSSYPMQRFGRPPQPEGELVYNNEDDPLTLLQFTPEEEKKAPFTTMKNREDTPQEIRNTDNVLPISTPVPPLKFFNNGHQCHEVTGVPLEGIDDHIDDDGYANVDGTLRTQLNRHNKTTPRTANSDRDNARFEPISSSHQDPRNKNGDKLKPISSKGKEKTLCKAGNGPLLSISGQQLDSGGDRHSSSGGSNGQSDDAESVVTPENWWSRFLSLIESTVLIRNPEVLSVLSNDIDLANPSKNYPKTVLLALYRDLNQSTLTSMSGDKTSHSVDPLSGEDIVALCDAIRFLESVDKQFNVGGREIEIHDDGGDHPLMSSSFDDNDEMSHSTVQQASILSQGQEWDLFGGAIPFGKRGMHKNDHVLNDIRSTTKKQRYEEPVSLEDSDGMEDVNWVGNRQLSPLNMDLNSEGDDDCLQADLFLSDEFNHI